jgi:hypothetical protein
VIERSRGVAALLGLGLTTVVAAGCAASSSRPPSTAGLAKRYLAIATPANRVLDKSFDALEDHDDDLGASSTDLKTIATTERGFDRDLLALNLPPKMEATATDLVRVNEARARLTAQAASATSVARLHRYESELAAMNVPVEAEVRVLRKDLSLPPPDTD